MEKPKISVIIPVYNASEFLKRAVSSVCLQESGQPYEIILVDDGSPDRCPVICDELAVEDSRIKVVHKKNGGLSSARNAGIAVADGEYLLFLDTLH
mgnify:CR=1 FL=1